MLVEESPRNIGVDCFCEGDDQIVNPFLDFFRLWGYFEHVDKDS